GLDVLSSLGDNEAGLRGVLTTPTEEVLHMEMQSLPNSPLGKPVFRRRRALLLCLVLSFVSYCPLTLPQAVFAEAPKFVTERLVGQWRSPDGYRIRLTGKVTVIDANTLAFEDGTRIETAGVTDAPDLEQKAMIDGKFYPCGKEAAEFLRNLIGD